MEMLYYYVQDVYFIVSRITKTLSQRKSPTAVRVIVLREIIKETHCTSLFQLHMFPNHCRSVNNYFPFDFAEQTLTWTP
jgi:hypothetical protein